MENEFEKAKKFLKKIRWIDNEIDALIEVIWTLQQSGQAPGMDVEYIIRVVRTRWQK